MRFARVNKYSNTKVNNGGYSFSSKLEAATFDLLKQREENGEIKIINCQDNIYLTEARILYIADFKCQEIKSKEVDMFGNEVIEGDFFWCESKGYKTDVWAIKKRLWRHYGPGKLEIYEGSWQKPKLKEVIIPKGEM